ncbi:MAG: hypothetical protein IJ250_03755 [Bacteroidales bacterium]|nr:hypothetical protein [Bacteroidales bacterium]
MKKTIIISAVMIFSTLTLTAQPPKPNKDATGPGYIHNTHAEKGPVGTATLLLLGLGSAMLGYKLHKTHKEEQ